MELPFELESYHSATSLWPSVGKHILGTYTNDTIIVYQAYNKRIGEWAAKNQSLQGCPGYSTERMTWIKPNFLWMMYRSGWGTKKNQESILALEVTRKYFTQILRLSKKLDKDENLVDLVNQESKGEYEENDVRIQWDPDHDPFGVKVERRAIQLGIRGRTLQTFLTEGIVRISDITEFVQSQFVHVQNRELQNLQVPVQRVYDVDDKRLKDHLGL